MCTTYYDTKLIYGNTESDKDLLEEDSIMNKIDEYSF